MIKKTMGRTGRSGVEALPIRPENPVWKSNSPLRTDLPVLFVRKDRRGCVEPIPNLPAPGGGVKAETRWVGST